MTDLAEKTYTLLKTVPPGKVTTYKALADALGTRAYRAIGQFMRNNPLSFEECSDTEKRVPCHRVVAADGSIGGFMGETTGPSLAKKIALLKQEGVTVQNGKVLNFRDILFTF